MRTIQTRLTLDTEPREIKEITAEVQRWVAQQGIGTGLLSVYISHTSASLLIQENASPDVRHDLEAFLRRIVPEKLALYRHNDEGPDADGRLTLGTWQGIFLLEHRASPHQRSLILTLIGQDKG